MKFSISFLESARLLGGVACSFYSSKKHVKAHRLAPKIPDDLYHLIKKAIAIRKHLERNRRDA
ncbi:unnamed protein product [Coffea canephora]|uniref:DH200=94 genomic scaffold, scaffold_10883 n=1 Tax=Coffea canephora TaxID=49390 RepID=A0A068VNC1_COFCA|nr:unnamed protein product [Coffea canephora]